MLITKYNYDDINKAPPPQLVELTLKERGYTYDTAQDMNYIGDAHYGFIWFDKYGKSVTPPDYLKDLNACFELVKGKHWRLNCSADVYRLSVWGFQYPLDLEIAISESNLNVAILKAYLLTIIKK